MSEDLANTFWQKRFPAVGTAYAFWAYQNRHNSTFGNVIDQCFCGDMGIIFCMR